MRSTAHRRRRKSTDDGHAVKFSLLCQRLRRITRPNTRITIAQGLSAPSPPFHHHRPPATTSPCVPRDAPRSRRRLQWSSMPQTFSASHRCPPLTRRGTASSHSRPPSTSAQPPLYLGSIPSVLGYGSACWLGGNGPTNCKSYIFCSVGMCLIFGVTCLLCFFCMLVLFF